MSLTVKHEYRYIETNSTRLHVLAVGEPENPLVVLLHGFPEYHRSWDRQVDDLAGAGFYVLVPDQRGYNLSDKPKRIGDYTLDQLALDVVGLIDSSGADMAAIAGHDWGAAVAWQLGIMHPERVERLIIVNVPHPVVFQWFYKNDKEQRKRSSYIARFQLPILPESMLRRNDFQYLENILIETSLKGSFSSDELAAYKEAWGQQGALSGMLNWYRAMVRRSSPPVDPRVSVKTLIIWGRKDRFLKQEMGEASLDYCEDGTIHYIDDATHWVLRDRPKEVNRLMIDFLR